MEKNSPRNYPLIVVLTLIILLLVGFAINQEIKKQSAYLQVTESPLVQEWQNNPDGAKFNSDYPMIGLNNPFHYTSITEVLSLLTGEASQSATIFFGFPNCPWCQKTAPVLMSAAAKNKIAQIHYYNPQTIREQNTPEYQQLLTLLTAYLHTDNDGTPRLYVPEVIFIKEGKIIGHHHGTVPSHQDPQQELTTEQRNELQTIFSNFFHQVYPNEESFVCSAAPEDEC